MSIQIGSSPRTSMCTMRARGFRLYRLTASSEATNTADAPSPVWLDTAAVIVPPGASGSSSAIASSVVSRIVSSA